MNKRYHLLLGFLLLVISSGFSQTKHQILKVENTVESNINNVLPTFKKLPINNIKSNQIIDNNQDTNTRINAKRILTIDTSREIIIVPLKINTIKPRLHTATSHIKQNVVEYKSSIKPTFKKMDNQ